MIELQAKRDARLKNNNEKEVRKTNIVQLYIVKSKAKLHYQTSKHQCTRFSSVPNLNN